MGILTVISQNEILCQIELAEKMGYQRDAKLLIMHADDLGVSHSVNQASIEAFKSGGISSSSIMVPCPWFSEIAQFASEHPEYCWGLHLTLTSEWKYYKWDGVASSDRIGSLLNESGHFYDNVPEFVENAKLDEVETELRAQIEKAINAGVPVSHLDSHMGALFANEDLFDIYVKMGNEYELPVLIPGRMAPPSWNLSEKLGPIQYPVDNLLMMDKIIPDWTEMYDQLLSRVQPGLNEIIVHLGYDDDEMQAIMIDHPAFGSEWRQKDLHYVLSDHFQGRLKEHNIHLVSWRDIRTAMLSDK